MTGRIFGPKSAQKITVGQPLLLHIGETNER
jgi:hypothetical protein